MTTIRYARLTLNTDITAIQAETKDMLQLQWHPHFNSMHYSGEWTVLPLRSPSGKISDVFPDLVNDNNFEDTSLLEKMPATEALLGMLHCPIKSVRMLNLRAGASIKPHRDHDLAYEHGEARLHFPIFTNDQVEFIIDGIQVNMRPGTCWYINANLTHSLQNRGTTDRIHLVVDCLVNDWLQQLFADPAAELSFISEESKRQEQLSLMTAMLKELEQKTDPASMALAVSIKQQLSGQVQ